MSAEFAKNPVDRHHPFDIRVGDQLYLKYGRTSCTKFLLAGTPVIALPWEPSGSHGSYNLRVETQDGYRFYTHTTIVLTSPPPIVAGKARPAGGAGRGSRRLDGAHVR
jgi:hypothetical protein